LQKKWDEVRRGDIVLFTGKTGAASFTTLKDKGTYFMPAKIGMRLDGYKIPILRNEAFIYNGYTELGNDRKTNVVRINVVRLKTNQSCSLSMYSFQKYFAKTNESRSFIERCYYGNQTR
tara:strand:+ start:232 stop:588 length:357 start_codon:yes stop_codon:yes gene_type:complete